MIYGMAHHINMRLRLCQPEIEFHAHEPLGCALSRGFRDGGAGATIAKICFPT